MRSFITGVTGFVGSHLAEYLLVQEEKVYGLYRWRSPKDNIKFFEKKLTLCDADLRDLSSLIKVLGAIRPQHIYHLAAQSYVPASFTSPKDTFETNTLGTLNLLESIRILKLNPLVHICSTADVYGDVKRDEIPIVESNQIRPVSPYAVSKAACELLAKQYFQSYGIKVIITRAFNHTGPRRSEVFAESSFAKQIAQIEKGILSPTIYVGNLKSVRTYADVRDIVKAYYLLLEKGNVGEVYNIAGDATIQIEKLLKILILMSTAKSKIKIKVDRSRLRLAEAVSKIPNDKKFRRISGWKPRFKFDRTLGDLLDYWRSRV